MQQWKRKSRQTESERDFTGRYCVLDSSEVPGAGRWETGKSSPPIVVSIISVDLSEDSGSVE